MKTLVIAWLCILIAGIITLFWHLDWVYNQPTPVPEAYHNVLPGERLAIPAALQLKNKKPVFLHFFNPDCPCSRFNRDQFKKLVKNYGEEINFVIVPVSKEYRSAEDIQKFFDLPIPVILDTTLAAKCGVYSTPQAVIIDSRQQLFYRGNYNKSRYCSNKETDYARIALDSLLNKKSLTGFDHFALQAYGCQLPRINAEFHD